ncbi:tRNA dihydrouridine(20/20a) synthase DusA [Sinorhizobium meliloti]|uniref:tRNA dihydrouridine(20/20a) synthase DusA n=1 Tax=Rhizobium meliloti TaxID=382 RepID=UPI000210AE0F|nr:tRNA dihydrouridine(20/20a) synthase DusA [Sinorhizobium meliloti]AEG04567.1 dihydrouridine synthase DuS [Sinorhizobium meliloti BL225C]MDE3757891.1 tRNA dihydrouridine(20/20a) synthase DusA [Sinorhizobium meliloti]MDE4545513.1 tRNA dihydrouridine(20/20a) synthase DusA [Sinorhizobium meliloti]MDE4573463.1 tRNA dihydrouridine(20/20a) synthase DusA [Sinorhizobium meliloti]MDW9905911.1 tRNA dihydrouridine(20/20a) synthase DusA [Sinorhizobium meliloti]
MKEAAQTVENAGKVRYFKAPVFAVAPMIDWTDRHYRFFARQLSSHALLYTEMIVADAILRGDREKLLGHDTSEHPVALQLGGSDPAKMAEAARIAEGFGYDEINMNVGCPSDRVQSGTFGACLMQEPALVADCIAAMKAAVKIPVTVKCRIGVDDQDPEVALRDLVQRVKDAGTDAVWVHARKAWLKGLSPRENREIPPLDYGLVHRLKAENANLFIGLNGGLQRLDQALSHLDPLSLPTGGTTGTAAEPACGAPLDGVMLGRAAYHDSGLLTAADGYFVHPLTGAEPMPVDRDGFSDHDHKLSLDFWSGIRDAMADYAAAHIENGGRLIHVTRHMVGLFQGWPGARRYRQILSTEATRKDAGPQVIHAAFDAVFEAVTARQAAE